MDEPKQHQHDKLTVNHAGRVRCGSSYYRQGEKPASVRLPRDPQPPGGPPRGVLLMQASPRSADVGNKTGRLLGRRRAQGHPRQGWFHGPERWIASDKIMAR